MPYIPDLAGYSQGVAKSERVTSVGYLWVGHAYPKGEVPSTVFERLMELVEKPLGYHCGYHTCNLEPCGLSGEFKPHPQFRSRERVLPVGSTEIIVPGEEAVFKAPSLILHYINFHGYRPPECFCTAAVQCPEPGTAEYFEAIERIAPKYGKVLRFFCGPRKEK